MKQNPYTLVLFTNNQHKVDEIKSMLSLPDIPIVSYRQLFKNPVDVVEDGTTFQENAILKVNALPSRPNVIYLAEDSGIEVVHLNGAPGIYSARYAGINATGADMCHKLLRECYGSGNRDAQYKAVMALRLPNGTIQTFDGIVKGTIAHEMKGEHGFGYDPIFIPEDEDLTFGELPKSIKRSISHRADALKKVSNYLIHYLNNPIAN